MNRAHRELQLPGARLRYRDEGAGRAVVFVHGWTLDLDMWEPQAPLAARAARGALRPARLRPVYRDARRWTPTIDDLRALLVRARGS